MTETQPTLDRFRDEWNVEVQARVELGVCGCGCGAQLSVRRGGNGKQKYVEGHRQRHHKARLKAEAKLVGLPDHLSLQTITAASRSTVRSGDAETRRRKARAKRKPDLRISYRKALVAVEHLALSLTTPGELSYEEARAMAQAAMRPVLPANARSAA